MNGVEVLTDGFGRLGGLVRRAVSGLSEDQLAERVAPDANTVAWLVWHIARGQDAQVAALAGHEEVWTADGWADRFGLPFADDASGYGQSAEEVGQVRAPADLLVGYHDAVAAAAAAYLAGLSDGDLDRVVDTAWDPPVTAGVRLVSILGDALQHAGQAAFVRGILRSGR